MSGTSKHSKAVQMSVGSGTALTRRKVTTFPWDTQWPTLALAWLHREQKYMYSATETTSMTLALWNTKMCHWSGNKGIKDKRRANVSFPKIYEDSVSGGSQDTNTSSATQRWFQHKGEKMTDTHNVWIPSEMYCSGVLLWQPWWLHRVRVPPAGAPRGK